MIVSLLIDKKYRIKILKKNEFYLAKAYKASLSGVVQHLKLKICLVFSLFLGLLFSI